MKWLKKHLLLLFICVAFVSNAHTEINTYKIIVPNDDFIFCLATSHATEKQLIIQKYTNENIPVRTFGLNGTIFLTLPIKQLVLTLLPNNDLLIGFLEYDNKTIGIFLDQHGQIVMQEPIDVNLRSCFEYANPITRTFDQLNVKRCMRVGGDLIVCGKIINDPVCNVTPCATQIER